MGSRVSLPVLVVAALLFAPRPGFGQASLTPTDRAAIAAEIERMATTARHAWATRNAALLVPDSALTVRTPDGGSLDAGQLRADLLRRMNMTTRVDTLVEALDSVRAITTDSVLAYSSQRFVRVIRLDDGSERQRVSTVIHERPFIRHAGRWQMTRVVREIDPRAWWANDSQFARPLSTLL